MPVLILGLKCVESMFFMISGGRVADIEIASTYKSIKRIKTNQTNLILLIFSFQEYLFY